MSPSALHERLLAAADRQGGLLRFDEFMSRCLYEPGLGYYSGSSQKFGAKGDFVTAPLLGPLFAHTLASEIAPWLLVNPPQTCLVTEFGAGDGSLAKDLLDALIPQLGPNVSLQYQIIELSADLQQRQRDKLAMYQSRVRWLSQWPESVDGVVIGNEVLDAMPVRIFSVGENTSMINEGFVRHDSTQQTWDWEFHPADRAFCKAALACLTQSGWDLELFVPGYRSEINLQAQAWIGEIANRLNNGAIYLFDYGFPSHEYYLPARTGGTLMAHHRHRAQPNVLLNPGEQDVTAHVDFSAIASAGTAAGLELVGYTSQARFLLNCGIADLFSARQQSLADMTAKYRETQALQLLISEAEMGELFKCIAFAKGLAPSTKGFSTGDRSHRL